MKVGVVIFPGSNCDADAVRAVRLVGAEPIELWHKDRDLRAVEAVILPGGFSYGDYLRTGAMAKLSPVMDEVRAFARRGGPVLGICNGFQILCEAGLLPGALLKNRSLKFVCDRVRVRVEQDRCAWTRAAAPGTVLTLPVAHGEGRYYADDTTLQRLEDRGEVVLRYLDNPNGSLHDIAGVCNEAGNVVGLMPHPERVMEAILGGEDGRAILRSGLEAATERTGRVTGGAPR